MGAISHLVDRYIERRFTLKNPPGWFVDYFGGGPTASGARVTHSSAMKYTPFWSCVRIISGTVAMLPFLVYTRLDGGGKDRRTDHPVYQLLHTRPNDYMDALTFIETRQANVLTHGNGYAEIQRDGAGRPVALWPLLPNKTARKVAADGTLFYEIRRDAGESVYLPDYNVLHIKGLGFDGYTGYDVVSYHREALGYGQAVKEYGARFFANGANPGGVLQHPHKLSEPVYQRLKRDWKEQHEGLAHAHRMQILEEGMEWRQAGVDPEKAQALEVQKWTVDDCARIFNIPPHKIGSMEFSKYNNVEQLQLDFVTSTMLYWFRKWEQECNYKLFSSSERKTLFCEILVDGLLRGDMETRYEAYHKGRQGGWLCVDDIRERENMNPLPDGTGKIYLEPLNMTPAGTTPPAPDDDPVRAMFRQWFTVQWRRIIERQVKALAGGANGDFYERQRDHARKLLDDPIQAYVTVTAAQPEKVRSGVDAFLREHIAPSRHLEPDQATLLADRTIQHIGEYRYGQND